MLWRLLGLIAGIVGALFATVIYAICGVLDFVDDVLGWLLGVEDEIKQAGGTQVHVLDGSVFVEYINTQKQNGNNIEMTIDQARQMKNSVINIATDDSGNMVREQMISGERISDATKAQFNGKPIISIQMK